MRSFCTILLILGLCGGCQRLTPQSEPGRAARVLKSAAGPALLPFVQSAAQGFRVQRPEIETQLQEARSSVAIQRLIDGELELAFTSRPVRGKDLEQAGAKGKQLHMVVIAAEAVAVIVHPDNPVRDLSIRQLKEIFFTGSLPDWSLVTDGQKRGPIKVFAVNPKTSGTGELFVSTITGDDSSYVPQAVMVDYSDDTIAKVAADLDAISFSGMGNVDHTVKAITIDGITPTEKAILDTSYVLNRKLFAITDGAPKGSGRDFIKFLLSETGQRFARATGVTPVVLE
jgi:phosphate transport system substrate-binding protein